MKEILLYHYKKYPQMQLEDFIKLLYQSYFKGDHLVKDQAESLKKITEEIEALDCDGAFFVYDDIGQDTVRLNLAAIKANSISAGTVNDWFVNSFVKKKPTKLFKKSIVLLVSLIEKNEIKLDLQTAKAFLKVYMKKPYALSHSKIYKEKYSPHYRIIKKDILPSYMKDLQFENYIKNIKRGNRFQIIALEGKAGAGKTTLCKNLRTQNITIISMDDFFLPKFLQTRKQLENLGGNIDVSALKDLLSRLSQNEEVMFQAYNCKKQKYYEKRVFVHSLVIVEGVYSYLEFFRKYYKKLIYLDINTSEQTKRLKLRDKKMYPKFKRQWVPMGEKYFASEGIISRADIII